MSSVPQWLVPLYPFTLKFVYEKYGNKGVDSSEFFNLTSTFIGNELQNAYSDAFSSVRLNWPETGLLDCPSDQFSPIYSSRHRCEQSSASGYVLFDISKGDPLPSRDELGNFELQLFRRGEESRERYLYLISNEADDRNIQQITEVYFTLNILSDGNGLVNTNNTSSKNSDLTLGGNTDPINESAYSLNAISVAAMIAAGAVVVLIMSLFYAYRRKEWDETRREALDARTTIEPNQSITIVGNSTNKTMSRDMDSATDLQIVNSDSMMAMSTMDDYYSLNQHGTQSHTFGNEDDKEQASVVSMESYAFSLGEMESGSRSFAQRSVRFMFDDQTVGEDTSVKQQMKSAGSF